MATNRREDELAATVRGGPGGRGDPGLDVSPGTLIGDYLVEWGHAHGGFAAVYRTTHLPTGRPAAVKVLHRGLATSAKLLRRFQREVELVDRLRHPNIVTSYGFGVHVDGRPYLAMEWLDGQTLTEAVAERGRFPVDQAVRAIRDLCAPLAAAHAVGVVHRDLKGSNVIAVPDGDWHRLTLVDFGIAKLIDPDIGDQTALTTIGARLGSPHSMAPEQILGDAIDARTDIYALGILFYQLLTGQPPFRGESIDEVEDQHLREAPARPGDRAPVPAAVEAVVLRCLEKAPARRYPDVTALRAALDAAHPPA